MTDQNHTAAFEADKAVALNEHNNALRRAEDLFNAECEQILDEWNDKAQAAQHRFDALKSTPEAKGYGAARQAVEALRSGGPDYRPAYAERARATAEADSAYSNAVAGLRAKHGIVAIPAGR